MNQISFALTIAFLFATIATTFYNPSIKDDLVKELTIGELAVYFRITIMRRNIYLAGLFLGFLCALVYIYLSTSTNYYTRLYGALTITFVVNYFFYILYPKPIYMLDILDSKKENKAWLKIYRYMQVRYHLAFVFGLLFAFFFYQVILS